MTGSAAVGVQGEEQRGKDAALRRSGADGPRDLGCVYYRALVHFEHLLSVLRALTLRNQNNSVH